MVLHCHFPEKIKEENQISNPSALWLSALLALHTGPFYSTICTNIACTVFINFFQWVIFARMSTYTFSRQALHLVYCHMINAVNRNVIPLANQFKSRWTIDKYHINWIVKSGFIKSPFFPISDHYIFDNFKVSQQNSWQILNHIVKCGR